MKTNGKHSNLSKFDIINRLAVKIKVNEIRDIISNTNMYRKETKFIVIHHDAIHDNSFNHVPIFEIYKSHLPKYGTFAYHYYVTKAGKLYQLHEDNELTYHCKGINSSSISLCLQGNFDKEYLSSKQYNSLIRTLILLKRKYPNAIIIGHRDARNTNCPGKNINVEELKKTVNNFHILRNKF